MKPTEILMHEHDIILRVLKSAEAMLALEDFPVDDAERIADFVKYFADGCHHKKEEKQNIKFLPKGQSSDYSVFLFTKSL